MSEKTPSQRLEEAILAVPPDKRRVLKRAADGLMLAARRDSLLQRQDTSLNLALEALEECRNTTK